jgi:hypothetical protein
MRLLARRVDGIALFWIFETTLRQPIGPSYHGHRCDNVLLQVASMPHSSTLLNTLDRNKSATCAQHLCRTQAEVCWGIQVAVKRQCTQAHRYDAISACNSLDSSLDQSGNGHRRRRFTRVSEELEAENY